MGEWTTAIGILFIEEEKAYQDLVEAVSRVALLATAVCHLCGTWHSVVSIGAHIREHIKTQLLGFGSVATAAANKLLAEHIERGIQFLSEADLWKPSGDWALRHAAIVAKEAVRLTAKKSKTRERQGASLSASPDDDRRPPKATDRVMSFKASTIQATQSLSQAGGTIVDPKDMQLPACPYRPETDDDIPDADVPNVLHAKSNFALTGFCAAVVAAEALSYCQVGVTADVLISEFGMIQGIPRSPVDLFITHLANNCGTAVVPVVVEGDVLEEEDVYLETSIAQKVSASVGGKLCLAVKWDQEAPTRFSTLIPTGPSGSTAGRVSYILSGGIYIDDSASDSDIKKKDVVHFSFGVLDQLRSGNSGRQSFGSLRLVLAVYSLTATDVNTPSNSITVTLSPAPAIDLDRVVGCGTPRFGLPNLGNTCYVNASLQLMYSMGIHTLPTHTTAPNQSLAVRDSLKLVLESIATGKGSMNELRNLHKNLMGNNSDNFVEGEQHDAAEYLTCALDQVRESLELVTLCGLQSKTEITCAATVNRAKCGSFSWNLGDLALHVNLPMVGASVASSVSAYCTTVEQHVSTSAPYRCARCGPVAEYTTQLSLSPLGAFVVITLNRWKNNGQKDHREILINNEMLIDKVPFRLRSSVHHLGVGSRESGHYTFKEGNIEYNDNVVMECEPPASVVGRKSRDAYILLYERFQENPVDDELLGPDASIVLKPTPSGSEPAESAVVEDCENTTEIGVAPVAGWAHREVFSAKDLPLTCPFPGCNRHSLALASMQALCHHIVLKHSEKDIQSLSVLALKRQGLNRCNQCNAIIQSSARMKDNHVRLKHLGEQQYEEAAEEIRNNVDNVRAVGCEVQVLEESSETWSLVAAASEPDAPWGSGLHQVAIVDSDITFDPCLDSQNRGLETAWRAESSVTLVEGLACRTDQPRALSSTDIWSHSFIAGAQNKNQSFCCPFPKCKRYTHCFGTMQSLLMHLHTHANHEEITSEQLFSSRIVRCRPCAKYVHSTKLMRTSHEDSFHESLFPRVRPAAHVLSQTMDSGESVHFTPIDHGNGGQSVEEPVRVFVDGSYKEGTRSCGGACFFGMNDARNLAMTISGISGSTTHAASNNRGEMGAMVMACRAEKKRQLVICSDSEWCINLLERRSVSECHPDFVFELRKNMHRLKFEKVEGHADIFNNEIADRMAKGASGVFTKPTVIDELIKLGVRDEDALALANRITTAVLCAVSIERPILAYGQSVAIAEALLSDDTEDLWLDEKPRTKRSLPKNKWKGWIQIVSSVLVGYSASTGEDRLKRQIKIIELPRTHLTVQDNKFAKQSLDIPKKHFSVSDRPDGQPEGAPSDNARNANIIFLTRLGADGKAARRCADGAIERVSVDAEILEEVEKLHSHYDPAPLPPIPEIHENLGITLDLVHRSVRKALSRGSASGLDGWTRELLIPIVETELLLAELTAFVSDLMCGRISNLLRNRLVDSELLVLSKPDSPLGAENGGKKRKRKVRPICPESVFMKLAEHVGLTQIGKKAVADFFAPVQFGAGGNVEIAAMRIKNNNHTCTFALDGTNAYTAMYRSAILNAVYESPMWRPLWGVTALTLAAPSYYRIYEEGKLVAKIKGDVGLKQGGVLSPLEFCLTIHPIIVRAMEAFPDIQFTLYVDDIGMKGNYAECLAAGEFLRPLLADIGFKLSTKSFISINADKEEFLEIEFLINGEQVTHFFKDEAVKCLGAFHRPDGGSVEKEVRERLLTSAPFFDKLLDGSLPFAVIHKLLKVCGIPRANFLARTHLPADTRSAMTWFDEQVELVVTLICGIDMVPCPAANDIIQMPNSMGGSGLRSMVEVSSYAHLCVNDTKKQNGISSKIDELRLKRVISNLNEGQRALLVGATAPCAQRVLTDPQVILSDDAFRTFYRQRLMCRVTPTESKCMCGADATNEHINVCKRLILKTNVYGPPTVPKVARHEMIADVLENKGKIGDYIMRREPPSFNKNNRNRTDLMASKHLLYRMQLSTDVTCTYPAKASRSAKAALHQLDAALLKAKAKNAKWQKWALERKIDFAPFVVESTGGIPPCSRRWLNRMFANNTSLLTISSLYDETIAAVAAAVQEGNHLFFVAACGGTY